MAQTRQEFPPKIVDTAVSLQSFIDELIDQVEYSGPKTLYLDLEGISLSRHGTISILTLLVHDCGFHPDRIYLIDIHTLGSSAFTTPTCNLRLGLPLVDNRCKTLKDVLESPTKSKVIFDVRNDADALFSHFSIRMQGVMDLQLMENAARVGRAGSKKYVHGLAKCIREDSRLSFDQKKNWEIVKDKGLHLFASEHGGSYEVFNKRPLQKEILDYCVQDVKCLPNLYEVYSGRLRTGLSGFQDWYGEIRSETDKRLKESTSEKYEPLGRDEALAPVWPSTKYARGSDNLDDLLESLDDYDDDDDWDRWEEYMDWNGEFYI